MLKSKHVSSCKSFEVLRTIELDAKEVRFDRRFAALEVHEPMETKLDELSTLPSAQQGQPKRRHLYTMPRMMKTNSYSFTKSPIYTAFIDSFKIRGMTISLSLAKRVS